MQNPPEKINTTSPASHWELFWQGSLNKEDFPEQLETLAKHYFARQNHLTEGMRMQELISPQELKDWDLAQLALRGSLPNIEKSVMRPTISSDAILAISGLRKSKQATKIPIESRPGNFLAENFYALLDAARSGDQRDAKWLKINCWRLAGPYTQK